MPLSPGTTLGVYEITAQIGAGGMGEVYRARDTALDRDVAIKVLPEGFATDPERLARLEREAKVLASLNHPNIAAIYGLERSGEQPALVLELVEGATLAELIERCRVSDRTSQGLPLDDALPIARQIAEALEAAHEQGIIHRDLKPANIKVRDDGTVKVLDFGLAKALDDVRSAGASAPATDAANSPTMTAMGTRAGIIMGTAAYMAPEQAKGRPVDKRTDIWAFGVVLYEMLAGRSLFAGADVAETLAAVLRADPAWDRLPLATPPAIRKLLRRCLERDPRERLRDIGDARFEINDALTAPGTSDGEAVPIAAPAARRRAIFAAAALALGLITGGLIVLTLVRPAPDPPAPVTRLSIVLPPAQERTNTGLRDIAISPTGTHLVYVANSQLYLRALDALEAVPLAGTAESAPVAPFFSPDGQWVGFFSRRDRALQKVALTGGAPVTLTAADFPYGASWGPDDTILVGQEGRGILRVAGAGGTPDLLVAVEPPAAAHQPQMLPGGEAVLYTLGRGGAWDTAQIVVERLATGERTVVVDGGSDARYLPTGHLVYALGETLLAVPFDVERLAVTGSPVPVIEGVSRATVTGAANADVAETGTLVSLSVGNAARTLLWVDREGNEEALPAPPRAYFYPRLSPDGRRVALDVRDEESDIWIWDLARETLTRLTFAAEDDQYPVWRPDGRQVVFASTRDGPFNLYRRAADGTGAVERLTESPNVQFPYGISPDGTRLLFVEGSPETGRDLHVLTLGDEPRGEPLIVTAFTERNAEISPDGRWVAYQSDASGQEEIYVQPFPDVDAGRWQVSTAGGVQPLWSRDGRELFYRTSAGLMAAPVETGAGFAAGRLALVVAGSYFGSLSFGRSYDVAPDGQRFLMIKEGVAGPDDPLAGLTQIHVVQGWFEELKARVPTGR